MDINGVVRYFKSVSDVSAIYVFGGQDVYGDSPLGLGVLVDDTRMAVDEIDDLEQDCILRSNGPLSVVMLNTAPLYLKHYVASRGRVLFERKNGQHLSFTRKAIDEYSSVAFDGPDDGMEFIETVHYLDPFAGEEEYLS